MAGDLLGRFEFAAVLQICGDASASEGVATNLGFNAGAGLFVVIAGVEKTSLEADLSSVAARLGIDNIWVLSGFSAVLSNLVSNVPAVLVFKPLLAHVANPNRAWLVLAMSSTLAGNLTVLGSVANLIVIQQARGTVRIGFWEYFRVGAPLTIGTIALGAAWLAWACPQI